MKDYSTIEKIIAGVIVGGLVGMAIVGAGFVFHALFCP